jgi:coenzyme F420-0:L-glutamate ligase/coenzyme F420-1:gamma-L-glutamate ligase
MSQHVPEPGLPNAPRIEVIGVAGLPEVRSGDRLGGMIVHSAAMQGTPVQDEDIVVVTQKVVSKAEGRVVHLSTVQPSAFARQVAYQGGKDPRLVELVLRESRAIVRMDLARGILITETRHGYVCANAGVDTSNVPGDGVVSLLPEDPDSSARRIRRELLDAASARSVAVIVSDTFGRAWREGHANLAIGVAGMEPLLDYRGTLDSFGNELKVTRIAVADELAAAAELVMGKAAGVPVAIVRGYSYRPGEGGHGALIRDRSTDLFR